MGGKVPNMWKVTDDPLSLVSSSPPPLSPWALSPTGIASFPAWAPGLILLLGYGIYYYFLCLSNSNKEEADLVQAVEIASQANSTAGPDPIFGKFHNACNVKL